MQIIDIHTHIYKKVAGITEGAPMTSDTLGRVYVGTQRRQFLPPAFENTDSKVETLVAYMDWCGIDKALLMPNPYYGYHNDYFLEGVKKFPDRLKAVALVNLIKGKSAADELAGLYDNTELFGFKVESASTFQCAPHMNMADPEVLPVWDVVNAYKQPAFLHMFTDRDVVDFQKLVDMFPDITWVICHMGADACFTENIKKENFDTLLSMVKKYPNIYMDTSSVPLYFQDEYPFATAVSILEKAYHTVGAEKLMWASDYPGMLNHATMKELINVVKTQCNIPDADKELIMGGNAKRLFFS